MDEEDAINVYISHCHDQKPLVDEQMHAPLCAVIWLAGVVQQKESSSRKKLLTIRSVDYLQ